MSWLGLLILPSLLGVVGFHMVQPNFRDLRISAAPLLPDPPQSSAPRNRLSLSAPLLSLRFWLRLLAMLGLLAALGARLWTPLAGPEALGSIRIVLDVSPSMGLPDGRPDQTRMDTAVQVVEDFLTALERRAGQPSCIDLVAAGGGVRARLDSAAAPLPDGARALASGGQDPAALEVALAARGPGLCPVAPERALIVTDRPEQRIAPSAFAGLHLWRQVGEPLDNTALTGAAFVGGGLGGAPGRLLIQATVFGAKPQTLSVSLDAPDGARRIALRRDGLDAGGWQGEAEVSAAGLYRLQLDKGGAYGDDDQLAVTLAAPEEILLDWQLPGVNAPSGTRATPASAGGVLVAPYSLGQPLPPGPFVLTYPGWERGTGPNIGAFDDAHPVVQGLNFDVFERYAPALPPRLPNDLQAVLGAERAPGSAWVATRDAPRGAVVPMPRIGGDEASALSLLIFFNALRWVTEGSTQDLAAVAPIAADGRPADRPWLESDIARALAEANDPTLLFDLAQPSDAPDYSQPGPDHPLTAWLIALTCLLLLIERGLGPIWRKGGTT